MRALYNLTPNARATEVNAVSGGIIAEYNKGNWNSDAYLSSIFTRLKTKTANLTEAINRIKTESNLEAKDEQRDNNVRAVYFLASGFAYHPDAIISGAAKKVYAVLEHYGLDIVNQSYATESSLINSLLLEFSNSEIQNAIAILPGLSQVIDGLRSSQNAFELAQLQFQEGKSKEGTEENATEIKKEVLSIINDKLVVHLKAMVQVDMEKYEEFAGTVTQIIDDMNVTVKKRKKTSEPEKDEDASGTTPESN
jgi:hypothetical protein